MSILLIFGQNPLQKDIWFLTETCAYGQITDIFSSNASGGK